MKAENSASIIRATCIFDTKKALKSQFKIVVTRFEKVS
jgi:hypothetical protein